MNIVYKREDEEVKRDTLESENVNLIIPQSNNYDLTFNWNGEEYELVIDASFWDQPYSVETFIDRVSQKYANDVIMIESQKIGFQPVRSKQHIDGSNTITLQRWAH